MSKKLLLVVTCIALLSVCAKVSAQVDVFGDDAADPVRLFERGQGAHARGELEKALGFYEQALKVRPEFSEAEFQRGNALASLGRLDEADAAFRRAISYKKNWSLPYSALGIVLVQQNRDKEAEQFFNQTLTVDNKDSIALRMLAELRLRAGDPKSALDHVLANEPENIAALLERADLFTDEKNFDLAIMDLKVASKLRPADKAVASRLAYALQQQGKPE